MPSIDMSSASGAEPVRAGKRRADGLDDPPPVGVAAVQRRLDQRRVGDRARGRLDARRRVPPRTTTRAIRARALAVGDHHDRQLAQQRVERLAEAQLVLGLGRDRARRDAPEHIRIAVSFVESCPSTEQRSNERLTHTPSSRSAVSGSSTASVCTKQSIVAKCGEIMPAPLHCAVRRTAPDGSSTSRQARFSKASVVWIACWKSASPSRRSSRAGVEDALAARRPPAGAG